MYFNCFTVINSNIKKEKKILISGIEMNQKKQVDAPDQPAYTGLQ